MSETNTLAHFRDRSEKYNRSSNWVHDQQLLDLMSDLAGVHPDETVLDLATGTGLVAKRFYSQAKEVIGVDISPDMTRQASAHLHRLLIAPVEDVPLPDAEVDCCVCRQGLQFADLDCAAREIFRLLKPGGRGVFCHLAAYGAEDKKEAFKTQELRNPARKNFFLPGDLERVLEANGLIVNHTQGYCSRESVNKWIDHGALAPKAMEDIRELYRNSSPAFRLVHKLEFVGDDIFDTMLMWLVRVQKPNA